MCAIMTLLFFTAVQLICVAVKADLIQNVEIFPQAYEHQSNCEGKFPNSCDNKVSKNEVQPVERPNTLQKKNSYDGVFQRNTNDANFRALEKFLAEAFSVKGESQQKNYKTRESGIMQKKKDNYSKKKSWPNLKEKKGANTKRNFSPTANPRTSIDTKLTFSPPVNETADKYIYYAKRPISHHSEEHHLAIVEVPKGAHGKIPLKNIHIYSQNISVTDNTEEQHFNPEEIERISNPPYLVAENREPYVVIPFNDRQAKKHGMNNVILPLQKHPTAFQNFNESLNHQHRAASSENSVIYAAPLVTKIFGSPKINDIIMSSNTAQYYQSKNAASSPQPTIRFTNISPTYQTKPTPSEVPSHRLQSKNPQYSFTNSGHTYRPLKQPSIMSALPSRLESIATWSKSFFSKPSSDSNGPKMKRRWPLVKNPTTAAPATTTTMSPYQSFHPPSPQIPYTRKFRQTGGFSSIRFPFNIFNRPRMTLAKSLQDIPIWLDERFFGTESKQSSITTKYPFPFRFQHNNDGQMKNVPNASQQQNKNIKHLIKEKSRVPEYSMSIAPQFEQKANLVKKESKIIRSQQQTQNNANFYEIREPRTKMIREDAQIPPKIKKSDFGDLVSTPNFKTVPYPTQRGSFSNENHIIPIDDKEFKYLNKNNYAPKRNADLKIIQPQTNPARLQSDFDKLESYNGPQLLMFTIEDAIPLVPAYPIVPHTSNKEGHMTASATSNSYSTVNKPPYYPKFRRPVPLENTNLTVPTKEKIHEGLTEENRPYKNDNIPNTTDPYEASEIVSYTVSTNEELQNTSSISQSIHQDKLTLRNNHVLQSQNSVKPFTPPLRNNRNSKVNYEINPLPLVSQNTIEGTKFSSPRNPFDILQNESENNSHTFLAANTDLQIKSFGLLGNAKNTQNKVTSHWPYENQEKTFALENKQQETVATLPEKQTNLYSRFKWLSPLLNQNKNRSMNNNSIPIETNKFRNQNSSISNKWPKPRKFNLTKNKTSKVNENYLKSINSLRNYKISKATFKNSEDVAGVYSEPDQVVLQWSKQASPNSKADVQNSINNSVNEIIKNHNYRNLTAKQSGKFVITKLQPKMEMHLESNHTTNYNKPIKLSSPIMQPSHVRKTIKRPAFKNMNVQTDVNHETYREEENKMYSTTVQPITTLSSSSPASVFRKVKKRLRHPSYLPLRSRRKMTTETETAVIHPTGAPVLTQSIKETQVRLDSFLPEESRAQNIKNKSLDLSNSFLSRPKNTNFYDETRNPKTTGEVTRAPIKSVLLQDNTRDFQFFNWKPQGQTSQPVIQRANEPQASNRKWNSFFLAPPDNSAREAADNFHRKTQSHNLSTAPQFSFKKELSKSPTNIRRVVSKTKSYSNVQLASEAQ